MKCRRCAAWLTSAATEVSSGQGDGSLFETYARHFLRFFQTTERICDEVAIEQYKEHRLGQVQEYTPLEPPEPRTPVHVRVQLHSGKSFDAQLIRVDTQAGVLVTRLANGQLRHDRLADVRDYAKVDPGPDPR